MMSCKDMLDCIPFVPVMFTVSAPGKLILFGEHSVVYGKTAVAASIDSRTTLEFQETDDDMLTVVMPKIDINLSFPFDKIKTLINSEIPYEDDRATASDIDHLAFVRVTEVFLNKLVNLKKLSKEQKSSLVVLFYLLHGILYKLNVRPFRIEVNSELTLGAGTGSSASYCVCLAAAFWHYNLKITNQMCVKCLNETELKRINRWAFAGERIIHGRPSGLDNRVCTYGSFVEMNRTAPLPDGTRSMDRIKFPPKINILLVDTKVPRNTSELVEKVNFLKHCNPESVQHIFSAMDAVSKKASDKLGDIGLEQMNLESVPYDGYFKELEGLIDMNQGLLSALGVSHWRLQEICNVCAQHGFHAKLTGAGGGGFAYTIIPPKVERQKLMDCIKKLEDLGYSTMNVILGGEGVKFH